MMFSFFLPYPGSQPASPDTSSGPNSNFCSVRVEVKQRRISSLNPLYRGFGYISLRKGDLGCDPRDANRSNNSGGGGGHGHGYIHGDADIAKMLGVGKAGQELTETEIDELMAKLETQSSLLEWEDDDDNEAASSMARSMSMSVPLSEATSGASSVQDDDEDNRRIVEQISSWVLVLAMQTWRL
ncbi:hypothetical protein K435DRAFT_923355 [Dendrothele bispora CBS 962.96]|uniref:Uncharacterized protein n=1 Tax=Dendrothele bispora (strain CBS 962.96) TaxID=1314807 RepID=A0A4V4HD90_DENBC|nr:hypothetical protein K435DRAFT_923355 [Dendrothele bispora CBS 962.96]